MHGRWDYAKGARNPALFASGRGHSLYTIAQGPLTVNERFITTIAAVLPRAIGCPYVRYVGLRLSWWPNRHIIEE